MCKGDATVVKTLQCICMLKDTISYLPPYSKAKIKKIRCQKCKLTDELSIDSLFRPSIMYFLTRELKPLSKYAKPSTLGFPLF